MKQTLGYGQGDSQLQLRVSQQELGVNIDRQSKWSAPHLPTQDQQQRQPENWKADRASMQATSQELF